ncbi:MAG: DUF4115 domain-containing protein [Acidobacteria bacterium]|nr:DUF4115 domain-containing protein [Acidobacteriota bacterium]
MESIASKLRAKRESLNISLEQISKDTRISLHHLESLENGRYDGLPGGMYNRAILRSYCDELGLDKNEILQCYDAEIVPRQEKPAATPFIPPPSKIKAHTVAVWSLIFIFCIGLFLSREWIVSALSPYFSSDYGRPSSGLSPERSSAPAKTVNMDTTAKAATGAQTATVHTETAPAVSTGGDDKAFEALPERTAQSARAAGNANAQPLRLEIVGREECWLSINSDESGAVTKTLSPGDVEFFTAARTISLIVGNAGGISLRINDHTAKALGQSGQVVRLTIDKDTLQNLIDPSAS